MYYSYVEIEYVATSFSPARTDLAVKLLTSEITMFLEVRDVDDVDAVVAAAMMVPVQAPVSACPVD
jgi:hypothetical protein